MYFDRRVNLSLVHFLQHCDLSIVTCNGVCLVYYDADNRMNTCRKNENTQTLESACTLTPYVSNHMQTAWCSSYSFNVAYIL